MVRLIKKTLESYPKRQSTSDTDKKKVIYSKQSDNWGTNNNSGSTEFSKANTVMYANRVATNRDLFIIDTGASVTMVKSQDLLHDYIPFDEPRPVKAANDEVMEVLGQGTLICAVDDKQLHIPNVGYVPKLMQNLISAPALLNDDDTISMTSTALIHSRLGKIGILRDVCESIMSVVHSVPTVALAQSTSPLLLLHEAWGHPNNNAFKYMLRQQSYSYNENDLQFHCQSCLQGKQFQNIPNIATDDKALTPLEVIHADVIGPLPTSITGDMFALVVSDEYSRYMCCIPMQRKSDVSELLIILIHNMETHHQCQVRQLRSDNGGEFQNNQLKLFCETKGIQHTFITPHMHHQNGLAERANRSVQDKARVLMLQLKLPEVYWPYAYKTAAFLLNATPKQVLNNISPFELWFGKPVDYNLLKPFGIQCYAHIPEHYRSRLDPNGRLCILLGFPDNRKAYTLLDIEAGEVVDSSHVKFLDKYYDGEFPTVQQQSMSLPHGITAIPRTTTNIRDNSQEEHDRLSSTQSGEDTALHDNDTSSLDTPELSSLRNFLDINDPSDANLSSEESDHEDMQITPLDNLSWFHNDHSDF
ncbi:hypothetical protein LELG_00913 [Lodderomyces elongisporus NRRL YB-4239]|uniref:Integrase catalytic domain-containing protein n=1 Tax=Lodderomyces elongisporus (strain ATCC 11503 / CBS 2605 / JCM 1781 / NBRC 1676 / NRRL YB-4239) TaxID=379508 RepID=A5DU77_LODEL|nr:hypothetical protein LELG_00913 [Lodderomyces elongisporus NRRL YB-4239]